MVSVIARMKVAGFLLALAAVAAGAQSLDHGHKIGSGLAYLAAESPSDGQTLKWELSNLLLQLEESSSSGSGGRVLLTPNATVPSLPYPRPSNEPCAAFETWAEQQISDFAESAAAGFTEVERTAGKAVLHRFVRDNLRQIYASYTVTVETLPQEGTYRVSFGPPTDPPPAELRGKADWKMVSPPKYPVPQIVMDQDSIRLELYSNGTARNATRRVVDYIHAGRQERMVMRKETPHDYYADDAELAVTRPRFRVNGVAGDAVAALPETIRGPVLWVYVPGYGRYILSLHPHEELGFESAGEAAGNSLTFSGPDGNVFRIDTAERIATGSGSYSVYVLADPGWEPADAQDRARVAIGSAPGIVGAGSGRL
jgi:hypothetical protein